MPKTLKKLAIVRSSISPQSITYYNSQELGLALELSKKEVAIDIFYASSINKIVNINNWVRIIYLSTVSLYKQQGLLKKINHYLFTENYDLIQVSEESMLQSILIARNAKKLNAPLVLLQGMYKSHSGFLKQVFQKTYNLFLLPILRNNIQLAICKTTMAQDYLTNLHFKNTKVIPVGFNSSILNSQVDPVDGIKDLDLSKKIILYIGKIEKRRNPSFILSLAKLYTGHKDLIFICVGTGDLENEFVTKKGQNIIHFNKLEQGQLQFLYNNANLFLMPTNYEIFGMVYLECMFFGVPVISTLNAGTKDLFKNEYDSFIMDSLDIEKWKEKIDLILFSDEAEQFQKRLMKKAKHYDWSSISEEYYKTYHNVLNSLNN